MDKNENRRYTVVPRRAAIIGKWSAPALLFATGALLFALQSPLPPETFVGGDSGVKLVATQHALRNPTRPLEIAQPTIGGRPVPYVEPFFDVHGDHLHAHTAAIFPVLTAPLLGSMGSRGVYVLPGIGLLGALAGWAWVARCLDRRRKAVVTIVAALAGAPWLFYGIEFWEHTPALALSATGTGLFVKAASASGRRLWLTAFASGLALGISGLFRPESLWFAAAMLVASRFLVAASRGSWLAATILGIVVGLTPLAIYDVQHFGRFVDPHLGFNARLAANEGWLRMRANLFSTWFVLPSPTNAWRTAPLLLLACVPLSTFHRRDGRAFLAVTALVTMVLVLLTAPNEGGVQWGPRYLLVALGPLVVLTADVLEAMGRRGWMGFLIAAMLVTGSATIQRRSYLELRGAKRAYAGILAFVRENVPPGGYLVTNAWWLDQVTAAATPGRQYLYAPQPAEREAVFTLLDEARVPEVTLVWSDEETPGGLPLPEGGGCYAAAERATTRERRMVAVRLRRSCAER